MPHGPLTVTELAEARHRMGQQRSSIGVSGVVHDAGALIAAASTARSRGDPPNMVVSWMCSNCSLSPPVACFFGR